MSRQVSPEGIEKLQSPRTGCAFVQINKGNEIRGMSFRGVKPGELVCTVLKVLKPSSSNPTVHRWMRPRCPVLEAFTGEACPYAEEFHAGQKIVILYAALSVVSAKAN